MYRRSAHLSSGQAKSLPRPSSAHSLRAAVEGDDVGLVAGVRGLSGSVTMERSEDEKLKFPDRINLDRKGLHGNYIMKD